MVDLLEEIHKLEIKHKAQLNSADAQRLESLQFDLTQLLDQKVEINKHRYFAHRFYEQGNKGSKLLARQLRQQQDSRHVHSLMVHNKQIDTHTIAAEFHSFYRSLYNIDSLSAGATEGEWVGRIQEYLKASDLQAIPSAALEKTISIEKLGRVIAALPMSGKCLGPDGFTNMYYKKFSSTLITPLCRYFNAISATIYIYS